MLSDILLELKKMPAEGESLEALSKLDAAGFLIAPGESVEHYRQRVSALCANLDHISSEIQEKNEITLFDWILLKKDLRIPQEILEEAAEINESYYGFRIDWVPGFFLSKSLGFLWGGCAVSFPEDNVLLFLIRRDFKTAEKWLIYRREELISHELCHIARQPLHDTSFEEFFAYRSSPSAFRRYMGNCFQHSYDALLFITPFFILLIAQALQLFAGFSNLPLYPFWILTAVYPLFLLLRNHFLRQLYFRAEQKLVSGGFSNPKPLLFRCTAAEIAEIASHDSPGDYCREKAEKEVRWKVILHRFGDSSSSTLNSDSDTG